MKTTKKVLAASLAVMMVAATVPFAASAAGETGTISVTLSPYTKIDGENGQADANAEKLADGSYTMNIYQVATFDPESGKYTPVEPFATSDITNKINEFKATPADQKTKSQQLVTLLNGVTIGESYTLADTLTFTITSTDENTTPTDTKTTTALPLGIYYSRLSDKPDKVKKVSNSLFVLDEANEAATATVNKIVTGDVNVTKTANTTTVGFDKDVTYTITASTVGSTSEKVKNYAIVDTMSDKLELQTDSIKVYGIPETGDPQTIAADNYDVKTEGYTYIDANGETKTPTFAIVFKDTYLNGDVFYGFTDIQVSYTAKVKAGATVNTNMKNTGGLVYGNNPASLSYKEGESVDVKTLGVKLVKYDGSTVAPGFTYLAGATFGLYTKNEADELVEVKLNGTAVTATTTNTAEGVTFKAGETEYLFADNDESNVTYYVKELSAPTGYNLNSTVYEVKVQDTAAYTFVGNTVEGVATNMVPNYAVTVPATGGTGTMVFTIVGASLIVCAGVLLFVLKRKNAAK